MAKGFMDRLAFRKGRTVMPQVPVLNPADVAWAQGSA